METNMKIVVVRMAATALLATIVCIGPAALRAQSPAQIGPMTGNLAADNASAAPVYDPQSSMENPPDAVAEDACCEPKWTATGDFLYMRRETRGLESLPVATFAGALPDVHDMTFDPRVGPQVSLIRHNFIDQSDLEVRYFAIDDWTSEALVNTTVNTVPVSLDYNYGSRLYSGEVNLRTPWTSNFTFLAGFRWAQVAEHFTGNDLTGTLGEVLDTTSLNNLYGLQIGGEQMLLCGCSGHLTISASAKAGVYENHADQTTYVNLGNTTGTASATGDTASFLGEASITICYQLTRHIAARVGGQALWLEAVALAPAQILTSSTTPGATSVNVDGNLFYYGGYLGVEGCF